MGFHCFNVLLNVHVFSSSSVHPIILFVVVSFEVVWPSIIFNPFYHDFEGCSVCKVLGLLSVLGYPILLRSVLGTSLGEFPTILLLPSGIELAWTEWTGNSHRDHSHLRSGPCGAEDGSRTAPHPWSRQAWKRRQRHPRGRKELLRRELLWISCFWAFFLFRSVGLRCL